MLSFLKSRPIDAYEAQRTLDTRKTASGKMELVLKVATGILNDKSTSAFFSKKGNGYLFETAELIEFIKHAECCMIVLGAHPVDDADFEAGDATVMIIPCDKPAENQSTTGGRGEMTVTARVTGTHVALEHPPVSTVANVEAVDKITFKFL